MNKMYLGEGTVGVRPAIVLWRQCIFQIQIWMGGGTLACSGWLEQPHLCYSVSSCPSTLCQAKLQCKAWRWADGYPSLVWIARRAFAFIFSSWLFPPVIGFNNCNFPLFSFCLQTTSSALKGAIQLGITHTVGSLSTKPERDVLMQDFYVVESIFFPRYRGKGQGDVLGSVAFSCWPQGSF